MNKLTAVITLAVAGLLLSGGKAHASLVVDFHVNPSISGSPPPPTVGGASGTYHVVITQSAGVYTLNITGDNNGNPPGGSAGMAGVGKTGVGNFTLTLLGSGTLTPVVPPFLSPNGSTTAYAGPPGGNVGGAAPGTAFGTTGGPWFIVGSGASHFAEAGAEPDAAIAPYGGNSFTGTFTISGGGTLTGIEIRMADGGESWDGSSNVVPEPASAVMLLPGMLPIGLAFLRRRFARGPGRNAEKQEA